jgi:hypothetical protein
MDAFFSIIKIIFFGVLDEVLVLEGNVETAGHRRSLE